MTDELNYERLTNLMRRISYKPNFEFGCRPGDGGNVALLHPIMYVPDSRRSYPPIEREQKIINPYGDFGRSLIESIHYRLNVDLIPVTRPCEVPPGLDQVRFLKWLRRHVFMEMEWHELDEWFKLDGRPVNDPHSPTWRRL